MPVPSPKIRWSLLLLLALGLCGPARGMDAAGLEAATAAWLVAELAAVDARTEVSVGSLDPRLRMTPCSSPLSFDARGRALRGRVSIHVRCSAPRPWAVYVPATVARFAPVVVLTRPVARGTPLQAMDLRLEERDTGTLRGTWLEDPALAVGMLAGRRLAAGDVLSAARLRAPLAVQRGQRVQLRSRRGTVLVDVPAEALGDAAIGEQVRVRNLRSQRRVTGRVTAVGVVSVSP